jgi:antitoxin YefM
MIVQSASTHNALTTSTFGGIARIRARILYMTTLPLAEVRANLSKIVDEAMRTHQRIEVTRQGRRAVVILSADDFDSIMETLAILGDQDLMREVRGAEAEADDGEIYTLDEVTEEMRAAGRLPR